MSSPPRLLLLLRARALDPARCLRLLRVSLVPGWGPGLPTLPGRRPLRRSGALSLSPFLVPASSRTGPHLGAPSAPRIPLRLTAKHLPAGLLRGLTDLKTGSLLAVCPGGREGAAVAADVRSHPGLASPPTRNLNPQRGAAASPWSPSVRRRVPNSPLSAGGRRGVQCLLPRSVPALGLTGGSARRVCFTNSIFLSRGLPVPNARTKTNKKL